MVRLSRRAWNNVLIITTLIMIVIFNSTSNLINTEPDASTEVISLIPEEAVILTMEFGAIKLERIGNGWRTQPASELPSDVLAQKVSNWRRATMKLTDPIVLENPFVVVVWLAGEQTGRVFQLEQVGNVVVVNHQQQTYRIDQTSLSDFVISEIN